MKKLIFTVLLLFAFTSFIIAQKLSIQTGHSAAITDLEFSPNGKFLASSGEDGKVILWDMQSSKQMIVLGDHKKKVNSISFHPTKNILASASDDKTIKLWEYPSGKLLKTYDNFNYMVKSVAFSPLGSHLACGSEYTYIIDLKTHEPSTVSKFSKYGFNALAYNSDGKYLAFGGKRNALMYLYDTEKNKIVKRTLVHANDLFFDDEKGHIYVAGNNANLKRIPFGKTVHRRKFNISASHSWNAFQSVVLSPEYFIAANKDNLIYVYNRRGGARKEFLNAHNDEVLALAIEKEGRFLASAGGDRKIYIWDLKKHTLIKSMEGGANRVNSISFSENGKIMFIGYNDGSFRIWNLDQKGKVLFQKHKELSILENYLRYKYSVDKTTESINTEKILIKGSLNQKEKFSDDLKIKEALMVWKLGQNMEMNTLKSKKTNIYQSFLLKNTSDVLLFKSKGTHSQKYSYLNKLKIKDKEEIFSTVVSNLNVKNINKDKTLKFNPKNRDRLVRIKGDLYFKAINNSGDLLLVLLNKKDGQSEYQIWDLSEKRMLHSETTEEGFSSGGFSPNDKYYYLVSEDRQEIKILDISSFTRFKEFKGSAPVTFNSDEQKISYLDSERNLYLVDLKSKNQIFKIPTNHSSIVSDLKFNEKYKYIATSSHDGLIKFWDINSGDQLISLAAFDENDFIYVTADNYYYSTKGAMNYIGFVENDKLYTFEQFDVKFNRPDKVFSKLSYSSKEEVLAYNNAYKKRVQKMGFANIDMSGKLDIPEIEISNADDFSFSTTEQEIDIKIKAIDKDYIIDRINIWVNDVPVFGIKGYSVKSSNSKEISKSFPIKLSTGRNKIQVSATNIKGFESLKETFSIICDIPETKPDLYIVAIGVSKYQNSAYDLAYAAKDANDISTLFKDKNQQFENIHTIKVLNKDATVENILKVKAQLEKSKVDDVVLLFFAGHGVLDEQMDYYLATTEIDVEDMAGTALRYDYLEGLFDGIPARKKVIIIDACHSGEVDKDEEFTETGQTADQDNVVLRNVQSAAAFESSTTITTQSSFELMKMMFADIRRGTGSTVISSAGGGEFAYETDKAKNGIFTYVLINGILSQKADMNKDGNIMISELRDYTTTKVSEMTKGHQNPTSRRENLEFDFKIW